MKITIGLVEDHQLVLKSLSIMMANFGNIDIIMEATSGAELKEKIAVAPQKPDIMLVDVSMPVMDGEAVAKWLNENYPDIKLVALSVDDSEHTIAKMINAGCCSYLLKTVSAPEFQQALNEIYTHGYYAGSNLNIVAILKKNAAKKFTKNELRFLELSGTEMTYEEIGKAMYVGTNRADDMRRLVFEKLEAKTRTDMVIKALKKGIIKLENIVMPNGVQ